MSVAPALRMVAYLGATLTLVGCARPSVRSTAQSAPLGTPGQAVTSFSIAPSSVSPPGDETTANAQTTPSPIVLTLTQAPSGRNGLIVFSATNNDNESHSTSFDVRLDELTPTGVWNEVHLYTTGTSREPGKPLEAEVARPALNESIAAGETKAGLTIALYNLPSGRYRILMKYQAKVIGYNTVSPAWSTPLNFSIT
jgi:hypothetical protein